MLSGTDGSATKKGGYSTHKPSTCKIPCVGYRSVSVFQGPLRSLLLDSHWFQLGYFLRTGAGDVIPSSVQDSLIQLESIDEATSIEDERPEVKVR